MKHLKPFAVVSGVLFSLMYQGCTPVDPNLPPKPTVSAQKVKMTFTSDIEVGDTLPLPVTRLMESVEITPAFSETNVTHYNVYWADSAKRKITTAPLAHIPVRGDGKVITHEFVPAIPQQTLASYVIVCTENNGSEFCGKTTNLDKFTDDLAAPVRNAKILTDAVAANDSTTCPGLEEVEKCGNHICEGIETESNCPADCMDYAVTSFNFMSYCDEVQQVYHPETIAEMQSIVAYANTNNLHVKVTAAAGNYGTTGSATGIVCSDGVLIITDKIDENNANLPLQLETFEGVEVVNAPAGMRMFDLGEWLAARGKQMGYIHLGWADATLAGAIGTSAHGSSPKNTNVLSHKVVAMDIINPQGQLNTYSRGTTGVTNPDLWQAMTTHLGYFGVIVGVRIAVEPVQNVHVKVTYHDEDELFNDPSKSVYDDIKDCDYGQYNWFPTLGTYMRWCGKTTTAAADPGAANSLLNPYGASGESSFQPPIEKIFQGYQLGACFPETDLLDAAGALRADGMHLAPPLLKMRDGKLHYSSDAIGPVYRMTSAHLIDIGREVFQMDYEIAVPFENMHAALQMVNDFAHGMNEKNREMPLPLIGVFVRFSVVDDKALMAYTGAGGDFVKGTTVVHIEMPIPVPINLDNARFQEYMAPYENINKRLISELGGRAHWGKNQYYTDGKSHTGIFDLQRELNVYGDRLTRFNNAIAAFDPKGMFANKQAKVIGIQYPQFTYPANW